ncbi:acyl carrier protein [Amycolatopsis tolypomycina]|uniref:Acyl carrier protein n=1 Tax=Amycolatopsis tolypomycina TaxID=208445 RepID=A0A1H4SZE0_9PSEU|nr:acyl carrier protein [Amycolatopsis tolypomycina]SEC49575.1 acyl carrier protein [Amycolatopsis tolypomycina]
MTEVKVELYEELRDLVCDVLELEPGEVDGTSSFVDDHGVDSLSLIELVSQCEKRYRIRIAESQLKTMLTLDGVYHVVTEAEAI